MKKCYCCKIEKDAVNYSVCKRTKDSLYSSCKQCVKVNGKIKRDQKNLENIHFISRLKKFEMGALKTITCAHCKYTKTASEYSRHDLYRCNDCNKKRLTNGYFKDHEQSKDKRKKYAKDNYVKMKEVRHSFHVKSKFGVSKNDYQLMMGNANGSCEICKLPDMGGRKLSVDHNHATGIIRGLLCTKCNAAIGALKTDVGIELLQNAIEYIKRTEDYLTISRRG